MKGLGVLAISIALSVGGVNAYTLTSRLDTDACETVYTNYYLFLEADVVGRFNGTSLSNISTTNSAVFTNNSYLTKNFDTNNIGYGSVDVHGGTVTRFSYGVPISLSLDKFYEIVLYASSHNGAYTSGNNSYIYSHNWYTMIDGNNNYNTGGLNLNGLTVNQLKDATINAVPEFTRLSNITPSLQNPFEIKLKRDYFGYLTGKPVTINNYQWYFHPAVYYVQYCSPKSNPAPVETYYNVTYKPGTVDAVTNMPTPITAKYNTRDDMYVSSVTPKREGYDFLGWTTDSKGQAADSKFAPGTKYTDRKDLVLYAVWKKKEVKPPVPTDPVDPKPTEPVIPQPTDPEDTNPPTGVSDYIVPFGGVLSAAGVALNVLKKKKGFKQF